MECHQPPRSFATLNLCLRPTANNVSNRIFEISWVNTDDSVDFWDSTYFKIHHLWRRPPSGICRRLYHVLCTSVQTTPPRPIVVKRAYQPNASKITELGIILACKYSVIVSRHLFQQYVDTSWVQLQLQCQTLSFAVVVLVDVPLKDTNLEFWWRPLYSRNSLIIFFLLLVSKLEGQKYYAVYSKVASG
ncbi:hypothetical protein BDZ97DRAFT_2043766 [Flammula alnicola]|nr:hypothetical protein BDZ97DRAFT_1976392 [Flammula alnicola]KAF8959291.1 hypothetical protein BDZ97DRAFT_2043766 [Flammula alnicola]